MTHRRPVAIGLAVLVGGCAVSAPSRPISASTENLASPTSPAPATTVPRPVIVWRPIPFGARRKREMAAYAHRHYGLHDYHLIRPQVIVEHYTGSTDFRSAYDTFATDQPDTELHELPQVCSHFIIDRNGTIYQLVALEIMCRHTVGLNWTAIGIEHVGLTDAEILRNPAQMAASLKLTRWLRCRYRIGIANVIGHNESLSSPFHRELVSALAHQTHDDFKRADMQVYRARLRRAGGC